MTEEERAKRPPPPRRMIRTEFRPKASKLANTFVSSNILGVTMDYLASQREEALEKIGVEFLIAGARLLLAMTDKELFGELREDYHPSPETIERYFAQQSTESQPKP